MSLAENVDKVHETLLEQEGLKTSDLPKNIRAKIQGWNLLFAKLKKSDDDETMYRSVQRKSIEIADKIQDFIEQDFEEEAEKKAEEKAEEKPEKKAEEKPEEKPTTKVTTNKSSFGNLVMEKKILTQLKEGNGRIRISQLKAIIGKEPDYPEQKVNTITLRKIFMSSEYRKI